MHKKEWYMEKLKGTVLLAILFFMGIAAFKFLMIVIRDLF
jgi:hypothetical protein